MYLAGLMLGCMQLPAAVVALQHVDADYRWKVGDEEPRRDGMT